MYKNDGLNFLEELKKCYFVKLWFLVLLIKPVPFRNRLVTEYILNAILLLVFHFSHKYPYNLFVIYY